jgi:hypothetical protein
MFAVLLSGGISDVSGNARRRRRHGIRSALHHKDGVQTGTYTEIRLSASRSISAPSNRLCFTRAIDRVKDLILILVIAVTNFAVSKRNASTSFPYIRTWVR